MIISKKIRGGFTLIELLVVIAIIGLLSAVVLAALSTARSQAIDGQAVESLHSLQNALEQYKTNTGNYPGEYTGTGGNGQFNCSATPPSTSGVDCFDDRAYSGEPTGTDFDTVLKPLVTGGYITKIPDAPYYPSNDLGGTNNYYFFEYDTYTNTSNYWSGQTGGQPGIGTYCGSVPFTHGYLITFYDDNHQLNLPLATISNLADGNGNPTLLDYTTQTSEPSSYHTYCLMSP